jgi:hypothetical protein
MTRSLLCVIEGRGSQWEAICLDLDIAVASDSLDGVMHDLEKAVSMYVEAAQREAPADRDRLLSRAAPLHLRVTTVCRFLLSLIRGHFSRNGEGGGSFLLPCRA